MKILLAGAWDFPFYEAAAGAALGRLGASVSRYGWGRLLRSPVGKAEAKWSVIGPTSALLNLQLWRRVSKERPDAVLVWRGTQVWPTTLARIRRDTGALLVSYNNDDPFGPSKHCHVPSHHHRLWRHYLASVPYFDLHLAYRPCNVEELLEAGSREVLLFPPYYVPELHHPVQLSTEEQLRYGCDAVFVGHYEADGRVDYLRELVRAGLRVRVFGGKYWTRRVLGDLGDQFGRISPAMGDEYPRALSGAKLCLCFLSKLNRDGYTRRCFEIPACRKVLLSERSAELSRVFRHGEEAMFFSSTNELVEHAIRLCRDTTTRENMAAAGYDRVTAGGWSVDDRMREFLEELTRLRRGRGQAT